MRPPLQSRPVLRLGGSVALAAVRRSTADPSLSPCTGTNAPATTGPSALAHTLPSSRLPLGAPAFPSWTIDFRFPVVS